MIRLANVEDRAARYPRTFFVPQRAERDIVPLGSYVKLIFECCGERLWVEVTGFRDRRWLYTGAVRNHPVRCGHVHWASLVDFGPEHIAAITHRSEPDAIPEANL